MRAVDGAIGGQSSSDSKTSAVSFDGLEADEQDDGGGAFQFSGDSGMSLSAPSWSVDDGAGGSLGRQMGGSGSNSLPPPLGFSRFLVSSGLRSLSRQSSNATASPRAIGTPSSWSLTQPWNRIFRGREGSQAYDEAEAMGLIPWWERVTAEEQDELGALSSFEAKRAMWKAKKICLKTMPSMSVNGSISTTQREHLAREHFSGRFLICGWRRNMVSTHSNGLEWKMGIHNKTGDGLSENRKTAAHETILNLGLASNNQILLNSYIYGPVSPPNY